jgi:hypothetical protein
LLQVVEYSGSSSDKGEDGDSKDIQGKDSSSDQGEDSKGKAAAVTGATTARTARGVRVLLRPVRKRLEC